jgi:hypothetical protein
MATYYFVVAEDDMWWVRVRGRAYGGFLLRSHAVKQAIHSARKCRGEAHVVVQEPQFRWRIEWSSLGDRSQNDATHFEQAQAVPLPVATGTVSQDGMVAG